MMWFFNRARGGGIPNGALVASLMVTILGLTLFPLIYSHSISIFLSFYMGIAYNLAERMGWGLWIGNLTHVRSNTVSDDGEGKNNGIMYIARKLVPNYATNMITYCRVALTLRGIWWAAPVFFPFIFFGLPIYMYLGIVLWLGISFPLACELGYITAKKYKYNWMELSAGWPWQEVFYGIMWDIAFIMLSLSLWFL